MGVKDAKGVLGLVTMCTNRIMWKGMLMDVINSYSDVRTSVRT